MSVLLGANGKIYRASVSGNTVTLGTEFRNVTSVTLNQSRGTADVTTRANDGFRAQTGTLREVTVEFEMLVDPSNTEYNNDYNDIADAWLNNSSICLAIFTEGSGGEGPVADWSVTNFNRSEALEDAIKFSVTLVMQNFITYQE